ncbi:hypothetical protein PVAND_002487 [Polypedilum vanderplanki]|uniref:Lipase domain-containing protein n=1 Tax=Polypedilum vanderplanki TaxID=319348 RepID=A0A9J6BRI2_POLVA|nr:hypothetical protein PVAND_002487 [Polypedilum vanderplanki]
MKVIVIALIFLALQGVVFGVVIYQLYSRNNRKNGQNLVYKNQSSLSYSSFNSAKKNKMLIHGFGENGRADFNKQIKDGLLKHDDYNVIVVDWSTASNKNYTIAKNNAQSIGKSIAQFIDWAKLDKGYLHIIGFDLGAHIAGFAGKQTKLGRVDKITGLDPVKKGFNINQSATRLSTGDARFVEVYHSNGGKIGIMEHLYDSDKYINDGKSQPKCKTDKCSHDFAWKVYADQLKGKKYGTYTCETLAELDGRGCGYLPMEWHGEKTGISQIVTPETTKNG